MSAASSCFSACRLRSSPCRPRRRTCRQRSRPCSTASARQTNTKPSYASLEQASDGTVKIGTLTLALPAAAGNPGMNVVIGEVSLAGIADQGEGLYQIGTAKFSNVKVDLSDPGFSATVTMPEGIAEDWYIKSLGASAHGRRIRSAPR